MKKKVLSGLLALALVVTSGASMIPAYTAEAEELGTTYYVSSIDGDDSNDGLSEDKALRRWTRSMRSRFSRETRYFLKKDLYLKTRRFISRAAEAKRHLLSCLLMERGTDRRLIPTDMVSGIRITEATWTIRTISGKAPSPPLSCLWM